MSALLKIPTLDTIVSKVLVRPRYLNGYDLAEFINLNREHLQAYYDAQCALAEDDEVLPSFREWAQIQFDLACEFRARMADEARGQ
jgi:hypothetical protein